MYGVEYAIAQLSSQFEAVVRERPLALGVRKLYVST